MTDDANTTDRFAHILPLLQALQTASYENHIYVMSRPDGAIKIGRSRDPFNRKAALSLLLGYYIVLHYSLDFGVNAIHAERVIHGAFKKYRLDGEWFSITPEIAINAVDITARKIGCSAPQISKSSLAKAAKALAKDAQMPNKAFTAGERRVLRLASRKSVMWRHHKKTCEALMERGYLVKSSGPGARYALLTEAGRFRMFDEYIPASLREKAGE